MHVFFEGNERKKCFNTDIIRFYQCITYYHCYFSNQFKEMAFEKSKISITENCEILEQIIGIYETNKFKGGVGIQASRFNHSCSSNVEGVWNKEESTREFRVIKKIAKGI